MEKGNIPQNIYSYFEIYINNLFYSNVYFIKTKVKTDDYIIIYNLKKNFFII